MLAVTEDGHGEDATIPENERVYAIGDIHGRFDLFATLVDRIRVDNAARQPKHVRLILLGDLVDRGPDSARVVTRCKAVAENQPGFVVLCGNHERAMLDALSGDYLALETWLLFGGEATLRSWNVPEVVFRDGGLADILDAGRRCVPADIIAWMSALPLSVQVGDYFFVHAGIRPGVRLARQTQHDLLWIREPFLQSESDHGCIVVHGHSIREDGPEIRSNRIGIDVGAYRTGRLIALGLEGTARWTIMAQGDGPAVGSVLSEP